MPPNEKLKNLPNPSGEWAALPLLTPWASHSFSDPHIFEHLTTPMSNYIWVNIQAAAELCFENRISDES